MDNFFEILTNLGYQLHDTGQYYRTNALYRGGDNNTALSVNKKTGQWIDFVENKRGSFEQLIQLTLNLKDISEVKNFLQNKYQYNYAPPAPKIKLESPVKFDKSLLNQLKPDFDYWKGRGISPDTLKLFGGGIMSEGKMKNRYCFPIFDHKSNVIGFSGRRLDDFKKPKWKHLGVKSEWKYPLFLNHKIIKEKREVILVESIGDMLALWERGIKNTIITFGTDLSLSVLNFLIKFDISNIIISLNNDKETNNIGNRASEKIRSRLLRYFDKNQIKIQLPPVKDWNKTLLEQPELIKF